VNICAYICLNILYVLTSNLNEIGCLTGDIVNEM